MAGYISLIEMLDVPTGRLMFKINEFKDHKTLVNLHPTEICRVMYYFANSQKAKKDILAIFVQKFAPYGPQNWFFGDLCTMKDALYEYEKSVALEKKDDEPQNIVEKKSKVGPYTYCEGPVFISKEIVTKRNFVKILDELTVAMPDYTFEPAKISEGGIDVTSHKGIPHDVSGPYKSFRMHATKWPLIKSDWRETWKDSDEVLYEKKTRISIWLKAFDGAACWTFEELDTFRDVFLRHGIVIKARRKCKLVEIGALGSVKNRK